MVKFYKIKQSITENYFEILSTGLGLFVAIMIVFWLAYSAYTKNITNILNTIEIIIILAATLTVLVFTYVPTIEDEKAKREMKKVGEFFLMATILVIIGIAFIMLIFVPLVYISFISNQTFTIEKIFTILISLGPIFAIFYRGVTYFFLGIMNIYLILQNKYPEEMWFFTPKKFK